MPPEETGLKTPCWVWTAGTDRKGYGTIRIDGKIKRAHRLGYEFVNGPIPEGYTVDHRCLRSSCVNPDHLEAITREENNIRQRENSHIPHDIVRIKWNPKKVVKFRKLGKYKRGLNDTNND